jgi:hypothetical protein
MKQMRKTAVSMSKSRSFFVYGAWSGDMSRVRIWSGERSESWSGSGSWAMSRVRNWSGERSWVRNWSGWKSLSFGLGVFLGEIDETNAKNR